MRVSIALTLLVCALCLAPEAHGMWQPGISSTRGQAGAVCASRHLCMGSALLTSALLATTTSLGPGFLAETDPPSASLPLLCHLQPSGEA
jgi:hypothetical protein